MSNFIVGDVARLSLSIADVAGVPGDPSSLLLVIKSPGGGITTYTSEIVKDSVGKYHFDLPLDLAGSYGYRWQSSGENQGVSEGGLYVYPQRVV